MSQAIWYFLRQDYSPRELIIVDSGADPVADLVPSDPTIRYVRLTQPMSTIDKRNLACDLSTGELIAHWDDDAWYSPHRLAAQAAQFQKAEVEAAALRNLLHYQPLTGRLWRHAAPSGATTRLPGAGLAYRRSFWNEHRFVEGAGGEMAVGAEMVPTGRLAVEDGSALAAILLRGSSTGPVNAADPRWQSRPFDELAQLLGLDLGFYAGLRANGQRPAARFAFAPVTFAASFMVYDGYGSMAEYLALGLARAGADVHVAPFRIDPTALSPKFHELWRRSRPDAEGIVLCHAWWGENLARFGSARDLFMKTVWETNQLPPDWPARKWRTRSDSGGAKGRRRRWKSWRLTSPTGMRPSWNSFSGWRPLCILPPSAGYRRLENHLYRVEIHQGGDQSQARFKWSRDNGTVVSAIKPDENGVVVNGSVIEVAEIGKDGLLTFASDPLPEWLELTDDRYELLNQRGDLAQAQAVDPATRTITFAPGPLPSLDAGQHPVVRRWDQRGGSATTQGVAMTGGWQALEDGVRVRFENGVYREGDFWLIPARTAIGFETGSVEWPRDGVNPIPQLPHGTQHHFARLALIRLNAGVFTLVDGADCRKLFPPLTAIAAVDVSFSNTTCQFSNVANVQQALDVLCQRNASECTLLVGPGEDLSTALTRIAGAQDALICLRAGVYNLAQPLRIENRRHFQVMGVGPGTRIVAAQSEAALLFSNCASVKVSNLHVETGVVSSGTELNGALTFLNCPSVTVEGASVRCAGGPPRSATGVTVRHTAPLIGSSARIHGCEMEIGHLQTGVLLLNVDRSIFISHVPSC